MKLLQICFVLLGSLIIGQSFAQMESPEEKVKAVFSLEQNGCEAYVVAKISVVSGWHINSNKLPAGSFSIPTQLNVNPAAGMTVVPGIIEPKPVIENNTDIDEILSFHKGNFIMKRKVVISSLTDFAITGSFSFQTCNDVKCLPEYSMKYNLKATGCSSINLKELQKTIISGFIKVNQDEAIHKDGSSYVLVNQNWYQVPKENSIKFYKKYLAVKLKNEK
jgi:hypothetical protein